MALTMRVDKGKHYPEIICDACGEKISDWTLAWVLYGRPTDGTSIVLKVVHGGDCARSPLPLSERLDHYMQKLLWNNRWGNQVIHSDKRQIVNQIPQDDSL